MHIIYMIYIWELYGAEYWCGYEYLNMNNIQFNLFYFVIFVCSINTPAISSTHVILL